jgi:hypothetical protein
VVCGCCAATLQHSLSFGRLLDAHIPLQRVTHVLYMQSSPLGGSTNQHFALRPKVHNGRCGAPVCCWCDEWHTSFYYLEGGRPASLDALLTKSSQSAGHACVIAEAVPLLRSWWCQDQCPHCGLRVLQNLTQPACRNDAQERFKAVLLTA